MKYKVWESYCKSSVLWFFVGTFVYLVSYSLDKSLKQSIRLWIKKITSFAIYFLTFEVSCYFLWNVHYLFKICIGFLKRWNNDFKYSITYARKRFRWVPLDYINTFHWFCLHRLWAIISKQEIFFIVDFNKIHSYSIL